MGNNKPIGGYFEWEFPKETYSIPHEGSFLVNNARSALQLILQSLGDVKKVYLPYYICDSVTIALKAVGISFSQYHIDCNLKMVDTIELKNGEYIIYTNYFGVMDSYCRKLAEIYRYRLIVDNAQALYAQHIEGTHSVYSYRKYIGVPDGGMVISDNVKSIDYLPIARAYNRCGFLLARAEECVTAGYKLFKDNDYRFRKDGITKMSLISQKILRSINHDEIIAKRKENFAYLYNALNVNNKLEIPSIEHFSCPLVYPFYAENQGLRKALIDNEIFVAQYWPNVIEWCDDKTVEYNLTNHIMALPIDQRYDLEDMKRIVNNINEWNK